MVVVVAAGTEDAVVQALTEAGEPPVRLGRITARGAEPVTYTGSLSL